MFQLQKSRITEMRICWRLHNRLNTAPVWFLLYHSPTLLFVNYLHGINSCESLSLKLVPSNLCNFIQPKIFSISLLFLWGNFIPLYSRRFPETIGVISMWTKPICSFTWPYNKDPYALWTSNSIVPMKSMLSNLRFCIFLNYPWETVHILYIHLCVNTAGPVKRWYQVPDQRAPIIGIYVWREIIPRSHCQSSNHWNVTAAFLTHLEITKETSPDGDKLILRPNSYWH